MKIAVGLSGGVDSAVAALLLKQQGHEVICITMRVIDSSDGQDSDAADIAKSLGLEHRYIDMTSEYKSQIIDYIQEDYLSGRTPNPCVKCNREVKFGIFLQKVKDSGLDFDKFATGHYAGIYKDDSTNRYILRKGKFSDKDQAYFLSLLTQEQLSTIIFPLADMRKPDVRAIARDAGLAVSSKKESQDLCLGEYRHFFTKSSGPGNFVYTKDSHILGKHKGFENYTIGQRKGLGIGWSTPLYVVDIDTTTNTVYLGEDEDLFSKKMIIRDINWIKVDSPALPFSGKIKIRYRDEGDEAQLIEKLDNNRYLVEFETPRRAITPGQLAVCYDGPDVCFAGFIESAVKN
ncbi:MAG: tRNA 2-thiouridine(34) synthase MnmA [Spirochaetales bacterium]|nr:tRNA 2-thiouridine(34) synthase MnmA [Spirochaetales bacterium]